MAQVVGVPKREPCEQCGHPVFFAERLPVGKFLYHRTCLKCARCGSQLALGSFYETETDGQFCCETCPDEEKAILLNNNNADKTDSTAETNRQSFSDKLAIFQTNGGGLLQKSLSDEEKSKSLRRLSELYSTADQRRSTPDEHPANTCTYNDKSTPLNGSSGSNADANIIEASSSDASDESGTDADSDPPALPTTQPPDDEGEPVVLRTPKPQLPSKVNVLSKLYGNAEKLRQSTVSLNSLQNDVDAVAPIDPHPTDIEPHNHSPGPFAVIDNDASDIIEPPPTFNQMLGAGIEQPGSPGSSIGNDIHLAANASSNLSNVTKENDDGIVELTTNNHGNGVMRKKTESALSGMDVGRADNDNERSGDAENAATVDDEARLRETSTTTTTTTVIEAAQVHTLTPAPPAQCISDNDGISKKKSIETISGGGRSSSDNLSDTDDMIRYRSNSCNANNRNEMVRSRLSQFEALASSHSPAKAALSASPRFNRSSLRTEYRPKPPEAAAIELNGKTVLAADERINGKVPIDASKSINHLPAKGSSQEDNQESRVQEYADNGQNVEHEAAVDRPTPVKRVSLSVGPATSESVTMTPPTPTKRRTRTPVPSPAVCSSHDEGISDVATSARNANADEYKSTTIAQSKTSDGKYYPIALNPFGSDDEDDDERQQRDQCYGNGAASTTKKPKDNLNPFDSSDDDVELDKPSTSSTKQQRAATKTRISTNPFGSDSENDDVQAGTRTPVPAPRRSPNGSSLHTTPEPSPRPTHCNTLQPKSRLSTASYLYGSDASLASTSAGGGGGRGASTRASATLDRWNHVHGSMNSLASTPRHRKGRAPAAPQTLSASNSPAHTPNRSAALASARRIKRAAPPPPSPLKFGQPSNDDSLCSASANSTLTDAPHNGSMESFETSSANVDSSIETQSCVSSYSEAPTIAASDETDFKSGDKSIDSNASQRRLIKVDPSLIDEMVAKCIAEKPADERVTYRRKIVADPMSPFDVDGKCESTMTGRQCEKMKENKESQNKNRQSQLVVPGHVIGSGDEASHLYGPNKSEFGKWKRRKGPAPSLPIPQRKVIRMLPLEDIRHELEVIEVQQQGLEKQGVQLEKMIRERCEGADNENKPISEFKPNSKEAEDLILQLFELVNEKNELFRRQAELMYLRRQHRLEQEQADIEYEVRVLMAQPECNKTDTDKAKEEALISRLVEIVQLRNEVVDSLEMDRQREAQEDRSIKERLERHTAQRDEEELSQQTPTKLSKKEKKKQKESKKLAKQKKLDLDKDADESEMGTPDKVKEKKKKKKFLLM